MDAGTWLALLITLAFWAAVIYGVVRLVRALKRANPNLFRPAPPRSPSPPSPRVPSHTVRPTSPAQNVPDLDSETWARVEARERAAVAVPPAATSSPTPDVPSRLPVKTKQYFFSRSEKAFYDVLLETIPKERYRVFPNVRLNDIFMITTPFNQRQGTYSRLRDKHVDFLIVALPDFQPVAAIELDGASHDNAKQQHRDAVKDVAFQSAGLPLLRLRAESVHTRVSLALALAPHLP